MTFKWGVRLAMIMMVMMLISPVRTVWAREKQAKGTDKSFETNLKIDAHNHILPFVGPDRMDFAGGAAAALRAMEEFGIQKIILMPHPFVSSQNRTYTYVPLKKIVDAYPDRFAFLGGGGTLNVMLHDAKAGVTDAVKKKFEQTAEKIIADGAIGFGEIVVEHFSMRPDHPYESAPANHELLLLLSDIAARHDVPVEIHMEAIPKPMERPHNIPAVNNPALLKPNIKAFEQLLSHNRATRIIWAHAGWDNTGERTLPLMRQLLNDHPNLFMNIKIRKKQADSVNHPLDKGRMDKRWQMLLTEFPDRFMIGTDQFFQPDQAREKRRLEIKGSLRVFDGLPSELAKKVGYENAQRIFHINLY